SLVEARQTCKDLALREAIESYSIFVESTTAVENFQVSEDIIQTIAAAYLQNVNVIEQIEEGRTITMTIEATVLSDEVQALVEQRMMAEEEENPPADSVADLESRLFNLFSEYEKKMRVAKSAYERKEYDSALQQIEELQRILEQVRPDESNPILWAMYQTLLTRSVLIYTLYRVEYWESQNNRLRAAANMRIVQQKAQELEKYVNDLRKIARLTDKQKVIQNACVMRCLSTLSSANKKISQYN
ncbi:hypothetical protein MUP95_08550, partial [bacterium]|nr:hypothetical protein [bacterium]